MKIFLLLQNHFSTTNRLMLVEKKLTIKHILLLDQLLQGIKETNKVGLSLLINLLGGPALNSRLTLSIREKHGYAYNIEANYTSYLDIGFWTIYVGCDKKHLKKMHKTCKKRTRDFMQKNLA